MTNAPEGEIRQKRSIGVMSHVNIELSSGHCSDQLLVEGFQLVGGDPIGQHELVVRGAFVQESFDFFY